MNNTEKILHQVEAMGQFQAEEAYEILQSRLKQKSRRRRATLAAGWSSVAALAILLIGLQMTFTTIQNPTSEALAYQLPDGSMVTLNKDARIRYSLHFKEKRNLQLRGEAFFKVTRHTQSPFSIKAGKSTITVLGTSFNVKNDEHKDVVEVMVKTGTVRLSNGYAQNIELKADDYGIAEGHTIKRIKAPDVNYMAWKDKNLSYNNSPLSYVLETLKNTYHCNIELNDTLLNNRRISTTFHELSLEEVMTSICLTLDLQYKKQDDIYVLYH